LKPVHFIVATCCLALLATLPACDGEPVGPVDELGKSWSWARHRDIKPTCVFEDPAGVVWVTDFFGRVLSYDGVEWTRHDTGTDTWLRSIWSDGVEVHAVGDGGLILRYDGATWEQAWAPYPTDLYEVWGTTAQNLWIVGEAGTILRRIDGGWERLSCSTFEALGAIWGTGPQDMYFGGSNGTMLRYDGNIFSPEDTGTDRTISDLIGTDADTLFATADDLLIGTTQGWKRIVEYGNFRHLAVARDSLYVISHSNLYVLKGETLVSLNNPAYGSISSIASSGDSGLLVAGHKGGVHVRGDGWTTLREWDDIDLCDIHGRASDDIYAVGPGTALRFDGAEWTPDEVVSEAYLTSVWCSDSDLVLAGGGRTLAHMPQGIWEADLDMDRGWVCDVWGFADGGGCAIDHDGGIYQYTDGVWSPMDSLEEERPRAVWGTSADDLYIASRIGSCRAGSVVHYDGQAWTTTLETNHGLTGIWGTSNEDIFTVGAYQDTIYHFDGQDWINHHLPVNEHILALHGRAPDDVYAGGANGAVLHYDGTTWTRLEHHLPDQQTEAIWCAPDGQVFVLVPGGGILRYGP